MMKEIFNYLTGSEDASPRPRRENSANPFKSVKLFLKYFARLFRLLFPRLATPATLIFMMLLVDVVVLEVVIYRVGLLSGKYFRMLSNKDVASFWFLAVSSILYIVINSLLKSVKDFLANLLSIVWRKSITLTLHELYFAKKNFYYLSNNCALEKTKQPPNAETETEPIRVNMESQETPIIRNNRSPDGSANDLRREIVKKAAPSLDNPDQRITQDVNSLCVSLASILPLLLITPFVIVWYGYQVEHLYCFYIKVSS
jgi:ATP-binding cassette subfamily D (ALD) protein 4